MTQTRTPKPRSRRPAGALVRVESGEERELARCLRQIAARRRRLAARQAELTELETALGRFEDACRARVGDLLAELRRIDRATADYRRRLDPGREPDAPEPEPEPDGFGPPDDDAASDGDVPPGAAGGDGALPGGQAAAGDVGGPARRAGGAEAEVRRLYLLLAKRCHPDLAREDEERRRREELMLRINEAFRDRNLPALRALERETEADDPVFAARPVAERLAWARAERDRLEDHLADLAVAFARLRGHELHGLWLRAEAGEPVLATLEDELTERLAAKGRRLDRLIAAHLQAEDERIRRRRRRAPARR